VTLGAEHVLFLPDAEPWLVERLADAASPAPPGVVVAVVGARGGAGATSFAIAYALAAARTGKRTLLVDADAYGGGIDLAIGADHLAGPRWADVVPGFLPGGAHVGEGLTATLPRCGEVTVLSWSRGAALGPVPSTVVEALLGTARRGSDVVVVDLPRSFDEASRVALAAADIAYVVCPAEIRACASGQRVAEAVRMYVDDVRAVVRGPSPTNLDGRTVAESLGLPLAGYLRAEPGIAEALDHGRAPGRRGRGPLARLCGRLVAEARA
jgi:secretion/DNA translocation related CpaE-like protein